MAGKDQGRISSLLSKSMQCMSSSLSSRKAAAKFDIQQSFCQEPGGNIRAAVEGREGRAIAATTIEKRFKGAQSAFSALALFLL